VSSVDLRSCAYRAGVREGDLILEIDGHAVADKAAYRTMVSETAGVARLYVRRGGKALFFGLRREAPVAAREKVLTVPAGSADDAAP
jgi:S1-C subfamily serine protease